MKFKSAFASLMVTTFLCLVPAFAEVKPVPAVATNEDPLFSEPFVDIDEWRESPERHRYVHGGFKGTDMRFSFYFPDKEQYQGRFFQYVTPVPDNENLAQNPSNGDDKIGFSIASGGYFIETNGGGTTAVAGPAFGTDPKIGAYRANAAAARYSRKIAENIYGPHRTYGYLFGGSGGGYRTLGSMENTQGVWDGAVPFVLGSPMAAPNVFAVRMHAMRILKDKFPQIVDAMDAGGSGDPYLGLNEEETVALSEVTRMGFPLRSWFGHKTMGVHAFTALYQGMVMADPKYFEEFWTVPGYLGANPPDSLKKARLQFPTRVKSMLTEDQAVALGLADIRIPGTARGTADLAWKSAVNDGSSRPVALQLEGILPDVGFLGGDLFILSGEAKGKRIALRAAVRDLATFGVADLSTLAKLRPGDEVRVDNSNFLAAQTYHRHQIPGPDYAVWNQFKDKNGKPLYPQRKINLGPMFAAGAAGTVPSGKFNGKIIVVESLLDREAFPWQADWYRQRFDEHLGKDSSDRYRLWFTDNALHGYGEDAQSPTQAISYLGVLHQALRDVALWVEKGIAPPASTNYKIVEGQVIVPAHAADRKGIQPTLLVKANGKAKAVVKPGESVSLVATVMVPPQTGKIVWAAWDFDGSGKFSVPAILPKSPRSKLTVKGRTSYIARGTYFPTLRVASERDGDTQTPYALIHNLGRVRVVVE